MKTIEANTSKYLRSPYLEIIIMISSIVLAYFGLAVLSLVPEVPVEGAMQTSSITLIVLAFFLLSVAIAMIAVIAGIGGGVIFTPLMLAFTSVKQPRCARNRVDCCHVFRVDFYGIFIKKGLGNYKLCMTLTLSQSVGALLGATLAVSAAQNAGALGEGLMRTGLGMLLTMIAVYLFLGGKKLEWPVIKKVDRFTAWLKLDGSYYEQSEGAVKEYRVTRAPLGILLLFVVGLIGGFFGMGGGWAITPALNLGMGLPLKLAAANSGIILGIGSCVSIWPYIEAGSIIPLFVLPWLAGQVIGGFIGSYALARIKVKVVRLILIGIMVFTAFGLITKGLNILGIIGSVPAIVQVAMFTAVFACAITAVILNNKKETGAGKTAKKAAEEAPAIPKLSIPASQTAYANVIHWVTLSVSIAALFVPIFVLVNPANNVLNPNRIFGAIFNGASPEAIWATSISGAFPGTHFYLSNITKADSWAMMTVNIGCAVGLLAVLPAVLIQLLKEKNKLNAALGVAMAGLIICAMTGLL
jgi:uncharacterized membrane protein YfcA